jgi:hypothetical protein
MTTRTGKIKPAENSEFVFSLLECEYSATCVSKTLPTVIASEAKQSLGDCFVVFTPRNDSRYYP